MVRLQMGDDGAALEDAATIIQQHWEALGVAGRQVRRSPPALRLILERGGILAKGDQHFWL